MITEMMRKIWIWILVGFFAFSAQASAEVWYGLYTDKTSYAPGDTVKVYASAPDQKMAVRLVKLDTGWTEVARSGELDVVPQSSYVGSFIEYPDLSLSGRTAFTLEGWFFPTLLGGKDLKVGNKTVNEIAVVAGQIGMTEAAAGIVITEKGEFAAYVSDTPQTDLFRLAIAPALIALPAGCDSPLDCWHHLALTYDINAEDGLQVKLYVNGKLAAYRSQTGPVADVSAPFRLGARSEAPGNLTGVVDGRLDSWTLWPRALSAGEIQGRMDRGLNEDDPAPAPAEVDLYVGFEGPYPSIADSSHNGYAGKVVNHGNPGKAGLCGPVRIPDDCSGHAFRLNHDQIVDANWQVTTEIVIPAGTSSGMYAVQAFPADSAPTQQDEPIFTHAFAIKPGPNDPRAPIAVVLPTNTWTVYNSWPAGPVGKSSPGAITKRSRYPGGKKSRGGENTVYMVLGDGVSKTSFHGIHRPSTEASPVKPGPEVAEYSMRAPNSMYLTQWLDAQGFEYDVYSDDDFDAGLITASEYRVMMPHSQQEYWTDGMLETLANFLDGGGSVVAPAGNVFTWRVVYGPGGIVEAHRKTIDMQILGNADLLSGIDGNALGGLKKTAINNGEDGLYHGEPRMRALGVQIHYVHPCGMVQYDRMFGSPFCLGYWVAANTGHWLWQGSGLQDDDPFGYGRLGIVPGKGSVQTYALGHEADTWVDGMPLPGLADGQQPVILAEGWGLTDYDERVNSLLTDMGITDEKAGTILYFPHTAGGHVLVIGASATPWALESDNALSGLMQRALSCFAYDNGCPQTAIPGDLDGDGDVDRNDLNILLSYRNQPASGCPECDLDGDGRITALDARKLVIMCTRTRCATG